MHRRGPLGVNDDVLRGHGAIEVESIALAQLVAIPAREVVAFLARGRGGRDLIAQIVEALLIFFGERRLYLTVLKGKLVVDAVVVEFGVVVMVFIGEEKFSGFIFPEYETGDVIMVFISDTKVRSHSGIFVVFLVVLAIIFLYVWILFMAGENLQIIISSLCYFACFGAVEIGAVQGHRLDTGLTGSAVRLCSPSGAAIVRRPLRGDVFAVFGSDG